MRVGWMAALSGALLTGEVLADVGDPQAKTDHPWYPGELSCSTFERLFATQADVYKRVTGRDVKTDEDKALASWFWRNKCLALHAGSASLVRSVLRSACSLWRRASVARPTLA